MIATRADPSPLIRIEPKFSRVQPRLPHVLKPHNFIARQIWRGELQDAEPKISRRAVPQTPVAAVAGLSVAPPAAQKVLQPAG